MPDEKAGPPHDMIAAGRKSGETALLSPEGLFQVRWPLAVCVNPRRLSPGNARGGGQRRPPIPEAAMNSR